MYMYIYIYIYIYVSRPALRYCPIQIEQELVNDGADTVSVDMEPGTTCTSDFVYRQAQDSSDTRLKIRKPNIIVSSRK